MNRWLWAERGVLVDRSNISKMLKRENWSKQSVRLISVNRSEDLLDDYRRTMMDYTADQLVFLDESIFNERTGWRHRAYGPIGAENRYAAGIDRGKSWSVLPAYSLRYGYLDCTGIKKGYNNTEDLLEWIETRHIPAVNRQFEGRAMCIILDNCSTYCDDRILDAIRRAGHTV